MNILLIEDDKTIRENLQELLTTHRYDVRACSDGMEGLEAAKLDSPDLILCDIMLPKLDGYGVLEQLKSEEKTAHIPFIFVSAKVERAEQRKGIELGADDYITKPFTSDELLGAIKTRIERQQSTQKNIDKALYSKLSNFTKINSHEYNTPLNGIIGISDALIDSAQTLSVEEIEGLAKTIKSSARRLHRTFTNFMLYMHLERGNRQPVYEKIDDVWIHTTLETLSNNKAEKFNRLGDVHFNNMLKKAFSTTLPKEDLYYVVEELIWNALRFSEKNTPLQIDLKNTDSHWMLCLSNTTSDSDFFDSAAPFKQHGRETLEQQGSGLGLYLCQKLADLYHWDLKQKYTNGKAKVCLSVPF